MGGRVFHAPVISAVEGLRLAAVVQRTGDSAAQAYPNAMHLRNVDELLAIDSIGLVVVATPNASHVEIARRCLRAGKHVVIDKPFAPSSTEAEPLLAEAEATGRVLSVFHNRRFDGDFLTVRRLIADETVGRPVLLESRYDRYRLALRPGAWKEQDALGGGVLFDIGPHLVDQALVLFGRPDAVTADVRREREGAPADDAFDVLLHYPTMRVLLRATMIACEAGPRFVLRGTEGTYTKHGMDPQEARLAAGAGFTGDLWAPEPEACWGILTKDAGGQRVRHAVASERGDYRAYYANVRDAIRGDAPLLVTAQQALQVVKVLEGARDASSSGKRLRIAGPEA